MRGLLELSGGVLEAQGELLLARLADLLEQLRVLEAVRFLPFIASAPPA